MMMTRRLKRKVGSKSTLTLQKVAPVTRDGWYEERGTDGLVLISKSLGTFC